MPSEIMPSIIFAAITIFVFVGTSAVSLQAGCGLFS